MNNIEATVGGRAALAEILSMAPDLSDKYGNFLTKLHDPLRAVDTLASICAEDGIMLSELLGLLKDASVARGMVAAVMEGGDRLPEVMHDIVKKSVDRLKKCLPCKGTGKLADGKECLTCYGDGKVRVESSLERQKLFGDWMGLGPKKGGVHVNVGVNQQVGGGLPGGMFSRLVKETDGPAYDVSPVKEIKDGQQGRSETAGPDAAVKDAVPVE
jgi:hypothetical protein